VAELELTRSRDDRRLYALDGVGTLRRPGLFWSAVTAEAGGTSWSFVRRGVWRRRGTATEAGGARVGAFEPAGGLRRGGTLRWAGRELALRPRGSWGSQRFALVEAEHELAVLDGKPSDRRPARVTLEDPAALEPGLLLFAVFVVRGLTLDAWGGIAAGTAAAGA
jgi:hypothetical protein